MEQEEVSTEEQLVKVKAALEKAKKDIEKYKGQLADNSETKTYRDRAVKAEAKLALQSKGIKDPDRLVKYLSLDAIDFDEQGNLTGLDESVETVKKDFPELFDKKRQVGGGGDIWAKGQVKDDRNTTAKQVDAIFAKH